MDIIKCITFDQEAQNNLPDHIKARMKADRDNARKTKKRTEPYINNSYVCESCGNVGKSDPETSFCYECGADNWRLIG
jgi:rubrerythrin